MPKPRGLRPTRPQPGFSGIRGFICFQKTQNQAHQVCRDNKSWEPCRIGPFSNTAKPERNFSRYYLELAMTWDLLMRGQSRCYQCRSRCLLHLQTETTEGLNPVHRLQSVCAVLLVPYNDQTSKWICITCMYNMHFCVESDRTWCGWICLVINNVSVVCTERCWCFSDWICIFNMTAPQLQIKNHRVSVHADLYLTWRLNSHNEHLKRYCFTAEQVVFLPVDSCCWGSSDASQSFLVQTPIGPKTFPYEFYMFSPCSPQP